MHIRWVNFLFPYFHGFVSRMLRVAKLIASNYEVFCVLSLAGLLLDPT